MMGARHYLIPVNVYGSSPICSPQSSASIRSISSGVSMKENTSPFSCILLSLLDLGMAMCPFWICQRRIIWPGGDFYDGRMLHEFAPEQRSPRHEPYAVFPAVCAQITLLIKRVQLDLVEYGETAERAPDFLQMFDLEIGYANPADESFLTSPQKFFVCAETLFPIRPRPMEKAAVQSVYSQIPQ